MFTSIPPKSPRALAVVLLLGLATAPCVAPAQATAVITTTGTTTTTTSPTTIVVPPVTVTPKTTIAPGITNINPNEVWKPYLRNITTLAMGFDVGNGIVAHAGPSRVRVPPGEIVNLTSTAPASGSLQWTKDGIALPGATGTTLSLPAVTTTDRGLYHVNGDFGLGFTSNGIQLDVVQPGQIANYSARLQLAANGTPQIIGVVIGGLTPKPVVLRVVGASLNDVGVTTSVRPAVKIFNAAGTEITINALPPSQRRAELFTAAGAFPLNAASGDFVIIGYIDPGVFTFQISDTSGQGGIALFELYEVSL